MVIHLAIHLTARRDAALPDGSFDGVASLKALGRDALEVP